jgi:hypothetical protein
VLFEVQIKLLFVNKRWNRTGRGPRGAETDPIDRIRYSAKNFPYMISSY